MHSIGLTGYLGVGAVLFVCGVICMATKRNGIGVLMGVELVLNGANINFVAFSWRSRSPSTFTTASCRSTSRGGMNSRVRDYLSSGGDWLTGEWMPLRVPRR
mgnify:CR=1 FL=1